MRNKYLKIKLFKSIISLNKKKKIVLNNLNFRKINSKRILKNNFCNINLIFKNFNIIYVY